MAAYLPNYGTAQAQALSARRRKAAFFHPAALPDGVMDRHGQNILSWRLSDTTDTDFRVSALKEALAKYGKPDIFNTDRGSRFTSRAFTGVLREKARQYVPGLGRCRSRQMRAVFVGNHAL